MKVQIEIYRTKVGKSRKVILTDVTGVHTLPDGRLEFLRQCEEEACVAVTDIVKITISS